MLTSPDAWRETVEAYVPVGSLPARPGLALLYPWQLVQAHARTRGFRRRVERAMGILRQARAVDVEWRLALSGGKDSLAVALLLLEAGWPVRAACAGDDAAMPGEEEHTSSFCAMHGIALDRVRSPVSVLGWLRERPGALTGDLHSRTGSQLARVAFYEPLEEHRRIHGGYGLLWGLRGEESRGRLMNRIARGQLYETAGGWRCQPISDWSALDVHAWVALHNVPLPAPYMCVDPGMDPLSIRTDWWFSGGIGASLADHYEWLRRWWPALWALAMEIDPTVRGLA